MITYMEKAVLLGSQTQRLSDLEFRIKDVARIKGVTMKELSEMLGVTPSYLSRINGKRINPSVDLLQKIAEALNVPVHQIIVAPEGYGHFEIEGEWHGIRKL